jgi:hypothetical protein
MPGGDHAHNAAYRLPMQKINGQPQFGLAIDFVLRRAMDQLMNAEVPTGLQLLCENASLLLPWRPKTIRPAL